MQRLVSLGFLLLLTGMCLFFFRDTLGDWTVVGWFRLTMGNRLNYRSVIVFYALAGIGLMVLGGILGLLGLLL